MTDETLINLRKLWHLVIGRFATLKFSGYLHKTIYFLSNGRVLNSLFGCQVILITTTGRKTGKPHTVPIFGFIKGEKILVVASNAGKKSHPSWYLNLTTNPEVQVEIRGRICKMKGRQVNQEERDCLWPWLTSKYQGYKIYQEYSKTRQIPVIILEPK